MTTTVSVLHDELWPHSTNRKTDIYYCTHIICTPSLREAIMVKIVHIIIKFLWYSFVSSKLYRFLHKYGWLWRQPVVFLYGNLNFWPAASAAVKKWLSFVLACAFSLLCYWSVALSTTLCSAHVSTTTTTTHLHLTLILDVHAPNAVMY